MYRESSTVKTMALLTCRILTIVVITVECRRNQVLDIRAMQYLSQSWFVVSWTIGNKFLWNRKQNTTIFVQKNGFKDVVCEALTIFPRANELSNDLSVISDKSLHSTARIARFMGPIWGPPAGGPHVGSMNLAIRAIARIARFMGPIWGPPAGGPHVGSMNLAIRAIPFCCCLGLPGKKHQLNLNENAINFFSGVSELWRDWRLWTES